MKFWDFYRAMRRSLLVGVTVLSLLGLTGEAAVAESAKGNSKVRKVMSSYAACVVRKHHDKAAGAILAAASNATIMRKFYQIIDSDCLSEAAGLGVDMRFPDDSYRYAIADALVSADFTARGPSSFADKLPLAQPELVTAEQRVTLLSQASGDRKRKALEEEITTQNALGLLLRYGECIARTDPENSRLWLLTPPEIPEEQSRTNALLPAFSTCLGDGTVTFSRMRLRGAVAVSYYRLAKATAVPIT